MRAQTGHPCVYDLGSGMLRRPQAWPWGGTIRRGSASCGSRPCHIQRRQAFRRSSGCVVAGRKDLIGRLARSPIMRALRPGRLLWRLSRRWPSNTRRKKAARENPVFRMLGRSSAELRSSGAACSQPGSARSCCGSGGQSRASGGGALPGSLLPGWAVRIVGRRAFPAFQKKRRPGCFSPPPWPTGVLGVLREGRVVLDVRCLDRDAVDRVADAVKIAVNGCSGK